MPQCMRTDLFGDARFRHRTFKRLTEAGAIQMMPTLKTAAWV